MWDWKKIGSVALSNNIVPIAVIALVGIAYLRYAPESWKPWSSRPTPPAAQAQEPKVVTKIERVVIPGPTRVEVIEKVKYVEKLPEALTPATASNPAAQIVASAEIPPHGGKAIATAILEAGADNVARGRIEVKELPAPFFQVKKEFGIRAGMGTGGLVIGEFYARPLRLGPVEVEARAFVQRENGTGADFGGAVLVDWRF